MAEQSAFLTAYDEMQKKKGGFNAPAPQESAVDTVGQAPAVQSPFSQQAAAATNPLAAPIDLSAVRQAPMLGGFEVKGAGAERFDVGTPEVPETLFSKEYTDPGGNTAAIARIEGERARANAVEASTPVDSRGFFEKFADATRSDPAPQVGGGISPFGGGTAMRTTAEGASGAVVDAIQSAIPMGLPGALPFEGTPSPATPAVAAPEVMGTPESIADLSVNGTDVVTPEAITEAAQQHHKHSFLALSRMLVVKTWLDSSLSMKVSR
jgi:hypothetical protein